MKPIRVLVLSLSTFLPSLVSGHWSVVRPHHHHNHNPHHHHHQYHHSAHHHRTARIDPNQFYSARSNYHILQPNVMPSTPVKYSYLAPPSPTTELLSPLSQASSLSSLSSSPTSSSLLSSHSSPSPSLSTSLSSLSSSSLALSHLSSPSDGLSASKHDSNQQESSSSQALQPAIVIRHPSTCTYDRNQAACTFQLLCYLAKGTPVEGCNDGTSSTCCYLRTNGEAAQPTPAQTPAPTLSQSSIGHFSQAAPQVYHQSQRDDLASFSIHHDPSPGTALLPSSSSPPSSLSSSQSSSSSPSSSSSSSSLSLSPHQTLPSLSAFSQPPAKESPAFVSRIPAHYLTSKFRTLSYSQPAPPAVDAEPEEEYNINQPFGVSVNQPALNNIRRSRTDSPTATSSKIHFPIVHSFKKLWAKDYDIDDICGRPMAKPRARIIGGQEAYFGEFPWQVHIKIQKHQCGGALLNNRYIVTAAHCIYQAPMRQLNVIIGAHDIEDARFQDIPPQYFSVEKVILHPQFKFSASHPDRFDIALVRLDRQVRFSDSVLPVCLPDSGTSFEGWTGVVTGWGKTDPASSNRYGTRLLQKVEVPIIDNSKCETWHRTRGIDLTIFDEMMCAGYEEGERDACVGDSGGPLVIPIHGRWTLAGITSAGFGCAQTRQPGIYHRVPNSVDWIKQTLETEMNTLQGSSVRQ